MVARKKKTGYDAQKWDKGKTRFTAERMNHIERGIAESHARADELEERLIALEAQQGEASE